DVYAEESGLPLGEGIGVLRDVIIAGSDEEAMALWGDSGAFVGAAWFAPFHFGDALPDPDTGESPDMFDNSLALVGTVDTVTRQHEEVAVVLACTSPLLRTPTGDVLDAHRRRGTLCHVSRALRDRLRRGRGRLPQPRPLWLAQPTPGSRHP